MAIYISHRLTIICAQKLGFWGFWRWRCEIIVFWPPKSTTLREYASVDISHDKISSRSVERFLRTQKKWVVTLAIWGEVTPGAILTKCRLWGDIVDVITCAIFRDCRLRGVGVVRGVSLPSPIDLTRRPYNTGHTTVWPCDIPTLCAAAFTRSIDPIPRVSHISVVLIITCIGRRSSRTLSTFATSGNKVSGSSR